MLDHTLEPHLLRAMQSLGYDAFKSAEQRQIIEAVIARRNVLGILPTGGGKSAAYMLPTIANKWRTLVVSPLKSLMEDQVHWLRECGYMAFAIHGDTPKEERLIAADCFTSRQSEPTFFFASPEMLLTKWWIQHFGRKQVDLLAVDEVHCVSTWGLDFRPLYLRVESIWRRHGKPPVVALSATVDQKMRHDIKARVPLKNVVEVVASPFRSNLHLSVVRSGEGSETVKARTESVTEQLQLLLAAEDEYDGPTIVYVHTKPAAEELFPRLASWSEQFGFEPVLYHAGLEVAHRADSLRRFQRAEKPLVVATTAFGMGIDRADVRRIVHFNTPYTLVGYAQEIGRAGRDGLPAQCVAFYSARRTDAMQKREIKGVPSAEVVELVYKRLYKAWVDAGSKQGEFSMPGYLHKLQLWVHEQERIPDKERYLNRTTRAISLLQQLGIVTEVDGAMKMELMHPGSPLYARLIEATKMNERRAVREGERLRRFFEAEEPTQALLWEIISS